MSDIKKKYNDNKLKSGASEVIPKYAKALKLLKARNTNAEIQKINSVRIGIRAKEAVDTEDELLHTNYIDFANNWYLSKLDSYKRTKVDRFPAKFVEKEKFPIVPFGSTKLSSNLIEKLKLGSNKGEITTYDAFNTLFPNESDLFEIGTRLAGSQESRNTCNTSYRTVNFSSSSKCNSTVGIEKKAFENYLIEIAKNELQDRNDEGAFTRVFNDNSNIKFGDYSVVWPKENNKSLIIDVGISGESSSIKYYIGDNNEREPVAKPTYTSVTCNFNGKHLVRKTLTAAFSGSTFTGAECAFLGYTDADYEKLTLASSVPSNQVGTYVTTINKEPPKELTYEQGQAYVSDRVAVTNDAKDRLQNYYDLINEVLDNLNSFDNSGDNYFLSFIDNFEEIGDVNPTSIENSKGFDFDINFNVELNKPQKKYLTVLTEFDGHNDAQFVEVPIYQKLSDRSLSSELFQIYKVKRVESGTEMYETMLRNCNDNKSFFSTGYQQGDEKIDGAYAKSFKNDDIFDVELFFENVFSGEQTSSVPLQNYLVGGTVVSPYTYTWTTGLIFKKKNSETRYTSSSFSDSPRTAKLKNANLKYRLTFNVPTEASTFSVPYVKDDKIEYESVTETYDGCKYTNANGEDITVEIITNDENTKKTVSIEGNLVSTFATKGDQPFGIPTGNLLKFVEHYEHRLKLLFEGYDKPVASYSLLDILSGVTSDDDIVRKYYFTRIESEEPILESGINSLILEDVASESNAESTNSFKLIGSDSSKFIPKYIFTNDEILKKLISIKTDDETE